MPNLSIGILETRRNAKLKKLAEVGPILQGSIAKVGVKCGNPDCKCARGEKHTSNILTKKVNGKTKSVYVPADMLEEAKQWTQEYKKVKELMKEISNYNEQILKKYVKTKKAKNRNLAVVKKKNLLK
jgi:hypothetical protein